MSLKKHFWASFKSSLVWQCENMFLPQNTYIITNPKEKTSHFIVYCPVFKLGSE